MRFGKHTLGPAFGHVRGHVLGHVSTLAAAIAVVGVLAGAVQAAAALGGKAEEPSRPVPEVLEDAGKRLLDLLDLLVKGILQYEMPEVQPNGDIVIRRKPNPPETKPLPPGQGKT